MLLTAPALRSLSRRYAALFAQWEKGERWRPCTPLMRCRSFLSRVRAPRHVSSTRLTSHGFFSSSLTTQPIPPIPSHGHPVFPCDYAPSELNYLTARLLYVHRDCCWMIFSIMHRMSFQLPVFLRCTSRFQCAFCIPRNVYLLYIYIYIYIYRLHKILLIILLVTLKIIEEICYACH